jgi:hypothetical protein
MSKRGKLPRIAVPTTGELFSGYQITTARRLSTGKPSRSAAPAQPPAPDATPIPRAPSAHAPTNALLRPKLGPRPTNPASTCRVCLELLGFPARYIPQLPEPVTFVCEAAVCGEQSVTFIVTTDARDYARARGSGLIVLHGAEFAALTLAAELGRVTPACFEQWLASKQATPSYELTPHVTLGVYLSRHDQRALVVSHVLRDAGARMVAVASASPAPPNLWERCHV